MPSVTPAGRGLLLDRAEPGDQHGRATQARDTDDGGELGQAQASPRKWPSPPPRRTGPRVPPDSGLNAACGSGEPGQQRALPGHSCRWRRDQQHGAEPEHRYLQPPEEAHRRELQGARAGERLQVGAAAHLVICQGHGVRSPGCPAPPAAGQAPDDEKHQHRHQRDQAGVTAEDAGQHDDGDDGDRRRRHPGGPERSGAGRGGSGAVTAACRRGRSVNSSASSPAVRACRARPVRSSSSSAVRRPAWKCSLSSAMARSRSASDTRRPPDG